MQEVYSCLARARVQWTVLFITRRVVERPISDRSSGYKAAFVQKNVSKCAIDAIQGFSCFLNLDALNIPNNRTFIDGHHYRHQD
ncbi:hypothetical protein [Nostoc sp. DedSLP04]|uniref:hypothetical protein n=1 Tax=Nostoc sp. DedSLP04 TaxID=3075401 RepID=UPI002AD4E1F2|nr:hypothetical protein [Nostoc sp. DedSLP04]MDZ8031359.1 hypothetical protein [Nostoc sp. DedSLP04]